MNLFSKISEEKIIKVGFQAHTAPFSFSEEINFNPIGYSVDLFNIAIKKFAQKYSFDKIQIIPVEITSENRLNFLQNHKIDIECGSTTITAERKCICDFTDPIYYTSHNIAISQKSINKFYEKKPINITGIKNSTSHTNLLETKDNDLYYNFIGKRNINEAINFFLQGHTDAIIADSIILKYALLANKSEKFHLLEKSYGREAYGFMTRKEDKEFLTKFNEILLEILTDRKLFKKIYTKWFINKLSLHDFSLNIDIPKELNKC